MSPRAFIAAGIVAGCSLPAHAMTPLCEAILRDSIVNRDKALSLIEAGTDVNQPCGDFAGYRPLDAAVGTLSIKYDVVITALVNRGAVLGGRLPFPPISLPSPERQAEFEAYLKDRLQPTSFAISLPEARYSAAKFRGDMRAAQDAYSAEYLERATQKQNETLRAFGQAALVVGGTLAAAQLARSSTPATTAQALKNIQPPANTGAANATVAPANARPSVVGSLQNAGNPTAEGLAPRPVYVSTLNRAFIGKGTSETEGCAAADAELGRGPNAYLTGKVLEYGVTGPCACKHVLEPGFGPARPKIDYYQCEIPYTARVESSSDPRAGSPSAPSRNTSR
ncbi:MAG: hypothetical protein V4573_21515 [Pseudomonadota bacterium]